MSDRGEHCQRCSKLRGCLSVCLSRHQSLLLLLHCFLFHRWLGSTFEPLSTASAAFFDGLPSLSQLTVSTEPRTATATSVPQPRSVAQQPAAVGIVVLLLTVPRLRLRLLLSPLTVRFLLPSMALLCRPSTPRTARPLLLVPLLPFAFLLYSSSPPRRRPCRAGCLQPSSSCWLLSLRWSEGSEGGQLYIGHQPSEVRTATALSLRQRHERRREKRTEGDTEGREGGRERGGGSRRG